MLLSLPIVLVSIVAAFAVHSLSLVPLGVALLVGALPNPACMGLQTLARELARGQTPDFADQWQGLRTYWRVGLRAWLIAAAITITCALNAAFYATRAANAATRWHTIAAPLSVVWTLILLLWLGVHLYVAPLLLAQAEARVLLAYRNAAVIMLTRAGCQLDRFRHLAGCAGIHIVHGAGDHHRAGAGRIHPAEHTQAVASQPSTNAGLGRSTHRPTQ
jgi:hypothetical protein